MNQEATGNTAPLSQGSELETLTSSPLLGARRVRDDRCGTYTIGELVELYMRSYSGRDSAISQRLGWWAEQFGTTPVGEIDDDHIYDLIDHLKSQGSKFYCGKDFAGRAIFKGKGKKLAPATVNRYVAAISSLFTFASKMRLTPKNWVHPCRGIGREREDNEVERYLSEDERSALFLAARKSSWDKLYLLVLMALVTGARRGNLLSLTWEDVDLEAGVARLRRTKNGDRRVLPLTPGVIQELKKFSGNSPKQLIFESSKVPGQPRDPSAAFQRALRDAKVRNFRFHDLRHTCGTYLARSGASTLQVAEVLGHRVLSMTKRYSHFSIQDKSRLVMGTLGHIG